MLENIHFYHNMQYQISPRDQTQEKGQKPLFWLLGPFKRPFGGFWMILPDQVLSKRWQTFRTFIICNNKLIEETKLLIMAKNLIFSNSDHSKCTFLIFDWSSMSCTMAKSCKPFSSFKICNIELIWWTREIGRLWSNSKRGHFWHVFVIIEWSAIFLDNGRVAFLV